MCRVLAVATIWGQCSLCSELLIVRLLFEGGVYSKKYLKTAWCDYTENWKAHAFLNRNYLSHILGMSLRLSKALYYGASVSGGRAHTHLIDVSDIYAPMKYIRAPPPNKSSVIQCNNEHEIHYKSKFNFNLGPPYILCNKFPTRKSTKYVQMSLTLTTRIRTSYEIRKVSTC